MGKKLNFKREIHNTSHNTGLFIGTLEAVSFPTTRKSHPCFLSKKVGAKGNKVKLSVPQNLYISLCREVRTMVISRMFLFVNFFYAPYYFY